MKIGVSTYSFSQAVERGTLKYYDLLSKAKEMGFDVIEYAGLAVPEGSTLMDEARRTREISDQVGLPIVNYCASADFINGSNGDVEAEIARVQAQVDVAATLGCQTMRHDHSWGRFPASWKGLRTFDACLPQIAYGCRKVTEYAQAKGIRTMVENHGTFCQESLRIEKILNAVNHPNFGLLVDVGNFICADEDPAQAVGRLAPFAFHVHIKDFHLKSGLEPWPGEGWSQSRAGNWWRGAIIGHGNVPVAQCIRNVVRCGYDHVLSVEFEGMEDALWGIELGRLNILRFLEMAKAQEA